MKRQWADLESENERNRKGGRQCEQLQRRVQWREVEVEKCVGGKETRERKTDGDLRATVTPGLALFIQGSRL